MSEHDTHAEAQPQPLPDEQHTLDAFLGATPRRARRQLVSLLVLTLALIAIAALFVRFVTGSDSPYYFAPVETGDIVPRLSEMSTVHGEDELTIRARLDGQLAALDVATGDRVDYGQVLGRIDSRGSDAQLESERAALAAARSQAEAAEGDVRDTATRLARFERVWRESEHRVPSTVEMERARAD
ncbi:biotin/lipoyl-binding protein, partial [Novosphingobium sp. 1949]